MNSIQLDGDGTVTIDGVVYKQVEKPKKEESSPRPWCKWMDHAINNGYTQEIICQSVKSDVWPANRDLILKAVNNFDAMMEILHSIAKCPTCIGCRVRAKALLTDMGELV